MNRKDILEIKKRFKKNECTFTKMSECYVDGNKNIIFKNTETFLNLEDDEFYKYLDIAKKTLSGTIGNNILELEFLPVENNSDSTQSFLLGLRDSKLKNEALLDRLYEQIIENYEYTGNFLILVFHDAYDVITKTTDNSKVDESEEVYEYILCAVCPVELSKAGLGYYEDENRIGSRTRDWVVGMPDIGFVYPAFSDRSSDIHALMYYTKNSKDTHTEFMENILGCQTIKTSTEKKEAFRTIINDAIGENEQQQEEIFIEIQKNLNYVLEEQNALNYGKNEPFVITNDTIKEIMTDANVPDEIKTKIEKSYEKEFGDTPPEAESLIDNKALTEGLKREKTLNLEKQVKNLKQQLEEKISSENNELPFEINENDNKPDIMLKVSPEKINEIKSEIIDGKKYIVIPLNDGETTIINGEQKIL